MFKKNKQTNNNVQKSEKLGKKSKKACIECDVPQINRKYPDEFVRNYNSLIKDESKFKVAPQIENNIVLQRYEINNNDKEESCSDSDDNFFTKTEYLAMNRFDRLVYRLSDERDRVQKKTFTKWMNLHLNAHGYAVNDLFLDLRDGMLLIKLLEILSNKTIASEKGISKIHSLSNIQTCLDYLKRSKIRLVNIHKDEIYNGNPRLTLGLIWILILYYQISKQSLNKDEMNAQLSLLNWCKANLEGYDSVRVNNFSSSWKDGRALIAILNRHRPDKISFIDSHHRSSRDNLKLALAFAESELGVKNILDPEDIDTDTPDEKSIMTYVSMIYNVIPNIPIHPSSLKEISHRKAILDEYSQKSRSLMEWLKNSIMTMDNKNVPSDQAEIKKNLNDIKQFRLEEYAARLKEKKKLIQLSEELTSILDSDSTNIENETKSVEKVWQKFDNYIQLRENLLEKTLKKFETYESLIKKIDKLYTNCKKRIDRTKNDFDELSSQFASMNQAQIRTFNERFNEHFIQCDNDLKKMFIECQHLKDEEYAEADAYKTKINDLQNENLSLKSKISNELKSPTEKKHTTVTKCNDNKSDTVNQLKNYLAWINQKTKEIENEAYPEELDDIERELNSKSAMLNEIQVFRESYFKEFKNTEENSKEKLKYNLNELEIAYNLLFNETNHRIKCLNQLKDLVESVNTELTVLDQKEETELIRDWSVPMKLKSSELTEHKNNLDLELNQQALNKIQPILNKGSILIDEKHPASNTIRVYIEALVNQLEWLQQLSHLLGIHLKDLIDLENFTFTMKEQNDLIDASKRKLLDILSNSNPKMYRDSIEKTEELKNNLKSFIMNSENLINTSKTLRPFSLRKQKVRNSMSKCECLIDFTNDEGEFKKNEQYTVEENIQRKKWKFISSDGLSISGPSVCFALLATDEDLVNAAEQMKKRCEALYRETNSCQRQFKKDRLLGMMNTIKFCELDEYDQRQASQSSETNLELLMQEIKVGVDELMNESSGSSVTKAGSSKNNDMKLIVESYERCCSKLDELSKKSQIRFKRNEFENEMNSDLDKLEGDLLATRDLLKNLTTVSNSETFQEFLEDLIFDLEDFQNQDLKRFDNDLSSSYRKLDNFQQYQHTTPLTRNKDNITRQRLDQMRQQSSSMKNNAENFSHNLNLVKSLIALLENANVWITQFETRLCNTENNLTVNELSQLLTSVQGLFTELDDVHALMKTKQNEFEDISDLYDRIVANKSVYGKEVSNLDEILDAADEIKKRNFDMFTQISERNSHLHEILDAYDQYKKNYQRDTKWIILLKNQILDYQHQQTIYKQQKQQLKQKYQTHDDEKSTNSMEDEINELKSQFDPIAQTYTELGSKSTQIDDLNQAGIELIRLLQRYNQLLGNYRNLTDIESITTNTTPSRPNFAIISQVRQELNNFNREYAGLLSDYNQKIKKLTNSIAKSDKHFSVHIKFQNAEPLIEKFNQDIFERYELINEVNNNNQHTIRKQEEVQKKFRPIQKNTYLGYQKHNSNHINNNVSNRNSPVVVPSAAANQKPEQENHYYYYDTINKDLVDINLIDSRDLKINSSNSNSLTSGNMVESLKIVYPLSFIDAVNKKQFDLETGVFRDPQTGKMDLRLDEALKQNLLDSKSAYFYDSHHNRTFNLDQAFRHDLLMSTSRGTIVTSPTNTHITLSHALKTGYLKIGQPLLSQGTLHNSSTKSANSITSETQSMSVRSILDPVSGEFLMPTEAIKRKLLDPYKGLFIHPKTGESLPISEAIQKGLVIVEILVETPSTVKKTVTSADSSHQDSYSNIISTSLIRETKSYHLLGVYDPKKNDEISIKEAIAKGILDRQKGLYIHPITRESFSISDAINKGVIRARILPSNSNELNLTENLPHQSLLSSNRFEENRTYTICGAIDMRTGKKLTLSQAIKEGVIDSKNGTYVNLKTGETLSINKAIDAQLVLTEIGQPKQKSPAPHPEPQRDVRILNIEFVKDPQSECDVTVSEAMQSGLLDRKTLNYHNPLSNEVLSLNKAYQKGYIIGHYTDSYIHESSTHQTLSSSSTSHFQNQQYFIISVFDPRDQKSMSLDQAVNMGLFDHLRSVYIHPITGEVVSLNDAVRRGFVDAQIFEDSGEGIDSQTKRFDSRLPVAAFGIDKKITCMRTKFNQNGTSILQVEIESLKPTRGVYELDEIEDFSQNSMKEINIKSNSNQEYRQVVDINSVHRIKEDPQQSEIIKIIEPINNLKAEKNVVVHNVDKEFGVNLDSQRFEKVIDDDTGVVKINIDHPKFRNNNYTHEIPERKSLHKTFETVERKETLIINDVDNKRMNLPFNIDGQSHVFKNELQIGNDTQHNKIDFSSTHKNVEELNRRLIEIESQKPLKRPETEIIDKQKTTNKFIDIDEPAQRRETSTGKLIIDIMSENHVKKPVPVETIVDTVVEHNREVYEESFPKIETSITEEIIYEPMEEEEEMFDEWTEVFTITIRNIRYKIIWVYDSIKNERVTLREAIRRGIISTEKNMYHNLKNSVSVSITEAVDDGLIGVEEDTSALIIKVNGITYTIYWVWDPVKKKRLAPKKAIERGVLNIDKLIYRNYSNEETINIHEAVYLGLIGASDDLTDIEEELILEIDSVTYKIAWIKDSISKEKLKPRIALKRGLLDLSNNFYNKYETKEVLTIREGIQQGFIGISNERKEATSSNDEDSDDEMYSLNRQDSLVSLDDEELTIKTKKAIYVITGLLHPETQKEIKVSEAIESGILNKDKGSYRDFKTNVIYDVGEAINEGFVFATVTDLLADETASTEFIREEVKRFIVKSVVDPRTKERIGGLQAQAAGILNYAQGMYSNPETFENIPINEAIAKNLIEVTLQEETSKEEFDAEVVTETLMERIVTNYRISGVLDPFSNEMISGSEAVHRQIIDTETNAYVDSSQAEVIPIKEAVRRNLIKAEITERVEHKTLGLTLQNAMRLGLFMPETGKFRDPYTNNYFDLNSAIEKGHINPNGNAVADSSSGSMTLNEAFSTNIFNKKTGILDRNRLNMFKGKIVEAKIYKWNFEDAVKCGLVNLKTGKYKHQQSGESLSIKDAINRGLIDGESTIIENPLTNALLTLKQTLDTVKINDHGEVVDPLTNEVIINLEVAFNHRKIFSAFNENTGEIFLASRSKIVPFEKAMRKNKLDKSIRIFDPKSNKDLTLNDAIERAIIDKTSGMVIDPKGGGLLSIKEAIKRGILCVTGAPVVTGHHENNETIETATITSRKSRHSNIQFDEVNENGDKNFEKAYTRHRNSKSKTDTKRKAKTPIVYDNEFLNSDFVKENPGLINNPTTKTTIKTTTEEHRKKISGQDVREKIKADFKETVLAPGEKPHVQSKAFYEKEYKSKLDGNPDEEFLNLSSAAFNANTNAFNDDFQNNNGHKIEVKTSLNGIKDSEKLKKLQKFLNEIITEASIKGIGGTYMKFLKKEKEKYTSQNEC